MKKFLFITAIFMSISIIASAQENKDKAANKAEVENANSKKMAYEKELAAKRDAEKKASQPGEEKNKEAEKVNADAIREKEAAVMVQPELKPNQPVSTQNAVRPITRATKKTTKTKSKRTIRDN